MKKPAISILSVLCLTITAFPQGCTASGPSSHKLEKKSVPVYCAQQQDFRDVSEQVLIPDYTLYYVDGVSDLPYVDLSEFVTMMNKADQFYIFDESGEQTDREDYTGSADSTKDIFTYTYKPQNSDIIIDFRKGTLTYTCFDTFGKDPSFPVAEIQTDKLDFLQRIYDPRLSRSGGPQTISLSDYGIPMLVEDGKYLLPLHTAFDFLVWAPRTPWKILCCNGAGVFIGGKAMFGYSDAPNDLGKTYYEQEPCRRSSELAKYGYDELCVMLDHFYGLKNTHHISTFRDCFKNSGYESRLLSEDPKEAEQALLDIIRFTLDDFHSTYHMSSWMSGMDTDLNYEGNGLSYDIQEKKKAEFGASLEKNYSGYPGFYEEYGSTAYLTLTMMNTTVDSERYYSLDISDMENINSSDVVEQILYADAQINRENSPIENVVIDLSLNSGGDVNSAACLLCWLLGEGYITLVNSFTGGLSVSKYRADINRDHLFSDADSIRGKKKVFCLISPLTFSSANMTAGMLKNSGAATIIGQQSLGGSGIVTPSVSGWDSIFIISGFRTVAAVKNGSWYDLDQGVIPDVYISDPDVFYNRETLTDIINGIK